MIITYARKTYDIDWSQPTAQIAQATGLDKATISRLRKAHAGDTLAEQRVDPYQPVADFPNLPAFLEAVADRIQLRAEGHQEIARVCGVHRDSVSPWLRGDKLPSPPMLAKLLAWWQALPTLQPAQTNKRPALRGAGRHDKADFRRIIISDEIFRRADAIGRRQNIKAEAVLERLMLEGLTRLESLAPSSGKQ